MHRTASRDEHCIACPSEPPPSAPLATLSARLPGGKLLASMRVRWACASRTSSRLGARRPMPGTDGMVMAWRGGVWDAGWLTVVREVAGCKARHAHGMVICRGQAAVQIAGGLSGSPPLALLVAQHPHVSRTAARLSTAPACRLTRCIWRSG